MFLCFPKTVLFRDTSSSPSGPFKSGKNLRGSDLYSVCLIIMVVKEVEYSYLQDKKQVYALVLQITFINVNNVINFLGNTCTWLTSRLINEYNDMCLWND